MVNLRRSRASNAIMISRSAGTATATAAFFIMLALMIINLTTTTMTTTSSTTSSNFWIIGVASAAKETVIPTEEGVRGNIELGNEAASKGENDKAADYYTKALSKIDEEFGSDDAAKIMTELSIQASLARVYSVIGGRKLDRALPLYKKIMTNYKENFGPSGKIQEESMVEQAKSIASKAFNTYGQLLYGKQQIDEAYDAISYATTLDQQLWAAFLNLGTINQLNYRNLADALKAYQRAYDILTGTTYPATDKPTDINELHKTLGELQYRIGLCFKTDPDMVCSQISTATSCRKNADGQQENCKDEAVSEDSSCMEFAFRSFVKAVDYVPTNTDYKHMLMSTKDYAPSDFVDAKGLLTTGDGESTIPDRAPKEYVVKIFDSYARNYESSMEGNGYDGPTRLRRAFDEAVFGGEGNVPKDKKFENVVDAGCGTGLVGEKFRDISSNLVGVDLSTNMLLEGKKKNKFDQFGNGDIMEWLPQMHPINLVLAGDVFNYFGDLDPVFAGISKGMADPTKDGESSYLVFTFENVDLDTELKMDIEETVWEYKLLQTGRYAHHKSYVERIGRKHNLQAIKYENIDGYRKEFERDVRGHLFVMEKIKDVKKIQTGEL